MAPFNILRNVLVQAAESGVKRDGRDGLERESLARQDEVGHEAGVRIAVPPEVVVELVPDVLELVQVEEGKLHHHYTTTHRYCFHKKIF